MRVHFDTEFTDLLDPKLISIGFATEDGRGLYIILNDGWGRHSCSSFVHAAVLPILNDPPGQIMPRATAASLIPEWLQGLGSKVQLCSDAIGYDRPLLMDLLDEELPPSVERRVADFNMLLLDRCTEVAVTEHLRHAICDPERRRHALYNECVEVKQKYHQRRQLHHALNDATGNALAMRHAEEALAAALACSGAMQNLRSAPCV